MDDRKNEEQDPERIPENNVAPVNGNADDVNVGGGIDVVSHMVPQAVPWASTHHNTNNGDGDDHAKGDETIIETLDDVKDACYFLMPDWKTRQSKFWMLLISACVIAAAGVVGDSTATVIGAMIVAPLMMPIQGLMVSTVLLDRNNFLFSLFMVTAGVGTTICIGSIFGAFMTDGLFDKENNSQVSSRINPALTDLLGALATGTVGAIALVRKDIAGALPGVSISISLVPPLVVCGLMLSIQDWPSALGAFLLWATNFLCIQVMGIITMYIYGIHTKAKRAAARLTYVAFIVCLLALAVTAVPLYVTSQRLGKEAEAKACLENLISPAVEASSWRTRVIVTRSVSEGNKATLVASVTIAGPPPFPDLDEVDTSTLAERCPDIQELEIAFLPAMFYEL